MAGRGNISFDSSGWTCHFAVWKVRIAHFYQCMAIFYNINPIDFDEDKLKKAVWNWYKMPTFVC